ncbi:uncharacterized protein MYCGRDRAFT_78241, partial [Zymoseptoria tritici IPO323]
SVESTTLRSTCVAVCVWKRHTVLQRHIEDKRRQRVGQLLFEFAACVRSGRIR